MNPTPANPDPQAHRVTDPVCGMSIDPDRAAACADHDGRAVHIGKDDLFDEAEGEPLPAAVRATVEQLEADGRTTMIVRHGDGYLGVLGLMDEPR